MTCSKLFSGDLPEISSDIIKNLRNDFNTLYSLTLVNRFWCRLAIPLLWEDPFSIKYRPNISFHFLDTYFLLLNDSDKRKLKETIFYEIDPNLKKPLFNYPSLIKTLDTPRMQKHITNWIYSVSYNVTFRQSYSPLTLKSYYEFQTFEDKKKTKVVSITLFKLFIENNAS